MRTQLPLLMGLLVGCTAQPPEEQPEMEQPWFVDQAAANGVDFTYQSGADGAYNIIETMGGGAALLDYDNDGDMDLYIVQGGSLRGDIGGLPNRLYENTGDGVFVDRTERSGASDIGYGIGVATGDYDNDGHTDLYVTNLGRNTLLRNDGNGVFSDVTDLAGVGGDTFSACAAFADLDRDGDLDLFVTNYLDWTPETEQPCFDSQSRRDYCNPEVYDAAVPDALYLNQGDGTFLDASDSSGIASVPGTGLGVAIADVAGDELPDIFVANDGMPDRLWENMGGGEFREQGMQVGCAVDDSGKEKAGMGADLHDIDGDGNLDLLVTNLFGETDSLFLNQDGVFVDAAARWGLAATSRPYTGWGTAVADFDNDSRDDLFVATGRVRWQPDLHSEGDPLAEPNVLYRQSGTGRFEEVQPLGGTATPQIVTSHGVASGDLDGDGGIDLIVINKDASLGVLHNVVAHRGNWIMLDVRSPSGSPAIGAIVTVRLSDGTQFVRVVRTARGYASAHDPRIHIGLGEAGEVQRVQVRWPTGEETDHGPLAGGQVHTITPG